MASEKQTIKEAQIPPEHAVLIVPADLMQGIVNYLRTKPWQEVNQALQALKEIPVMDARNMNVKE